MVHEKADRWTLSEVASQIAAMDLVDLTLRLTLLTLLLHPIGDWLLRPIILGLVSSSFLFPGLLRNPWLWGVLTVLTGLRVAIDWQLADNHGYLLCYWCLAVTLALVSHDPRDCLALNGRLLIGWAFAFATLWKLLSPDYLDGRFFRVMMLSDLRFAEFAQLAGGLTPDLFDTLREFVHQHVDGPLLEPLPTPAAPNRFLWLAHFLTLWTVGIEGAVAVTFLWPLGRGLSRMRNIVLLSFCVTTYAVATITGFGWLLLAMGVAQCGPKRWTRFFYLAVFGLILFYSHVPWAEWLLAYTLTD